MLIDLNKLQESTAENALSFVDLLTDDLLNTHDSRRELGALDDLYDELASLHYDISRGVYNNILKRFEEIFIIADGYNISWSSYKERFYNHMVKHLNILNIDDISELDVK